MAKTIKQTLMDEVYYPIPEGTVENKLIARGLEGEGEISSEIMKSKEFMGALADCFWSLVVAIDFSESDISVSLPDRKFLIKRANAYYRAIGEEEKPEDEATVQFGGW